VSTSLKKTIASCALVLAKVSCYEALVFDLDGTLWDSTETVARAWNSALAELGFARRLEPSDIGSIMGLNHQQIGTRLFPELSPKEWGSLSERCYVEEERLIRSQGGHLYAGVRESLAGLELPKAIVSNCQSGYIEAFLAWSQLGARFCDWCCHGDTGLSKAENLRLVMKRQGWNKVLYIGDTAGDQQAASLAGCDFVWAAFGFGELRGSDSIQQFRDLEQHVFATGMV
jgi:phosphoglycolate phosphatase